MIRFGLQLGFDLPSQMLLDLPVPRSVPVMAGSEIRAMNADQGLLVYRGSKPIKLHVPSVWDVPALARRVRANQAAFDAFCAGEKS